jgi:hypothetical protein
MRGSKGMKRTRSDQHPESRRRHVNGLPKELYNETWVAVQPYLVKRGLNEKRGAFGWMEIDVTPA